MNCFDIIIIIVTLCSDDTLISPFEQPFIVLAILRVSMLFSLQFSINKRPIQRKIKYC